MQHIWSVLCQKSSIDFETNLVSLFECIEEVNMVFNGTQAASNEKMMIPVDWQLVNYWIVDNPLNEEVLEMKIDFINPEGEVFNTYKNKIETQKNMKRFRSRMNINGFEVTKSGRYNILVSYKNGDDYAEVCKLPVDININFNINSNPTSGNN